MILPSRGFFVSMSAKERPCIAWCPNLFLFFFLQLLVRIWSESLCLACAWIDEIQIRCETELFRRPPHCVLLELRLNLLLVVTVSREHVQLQKSVRLSTFSPYALLIAILRFINALQIPTLDFQLKITLTRLGNLTLIPFRCYLSMDSAATHHCYK
jgi:hypothetical protein